MSKKYFLASVVIVALLFASSSRVAADTYAFTVTDFSADYYLTNADPQGQMHVVEKISVDFTDNNHGILRAIPDSYKNQSLAVHINSVSSTTGAPAEYTSYKENSNEVLKVGDPDKTVTGKQEYTIDYNLQNVITFYNDHDELYWDVNGDQWNQPFTKVHVTVHVPPGLRVAVPPACFTGAFGSTDSKDCSASQGEGRILASASNLAPGFTLTFVVGFAKGYFHPVQFSDIWHDYVGYVLGFVIPAVLIGGAGCIWWWKRGRDAKGMGVIIPQYDAPDGMTPLEVGALVDFKVDNRDLTATIISLAIRKYLKIVEDDDKKLLVINHKSYHLELVNKDWSALNAWEQELMGGLFGALGENTSVRLADMATKLQTEAKSIKRLVEQSLTDRGYFVTNPMKYISVTMGAMVLVGLAVIWNVPVARQGTILWGAVLGGAIFGIFYHFMAAHTAKGVAANEHILGLKLYLEVAEKDRLNMLQGPDARYAPRTDAPSQTIELFEKLLPYAIALKVEKRWAKKFEHIYTSPPDWYAGNYTAFSAGYLVGSLGSGFNTAMVSSFSPPRSASGSGFGGGGFAGGGGGGGGGGGW